MQREEYSTSSQGIDINSLLSKLDKVKKSKDGWTALCPAHDDHNPSLSVGIGDKGILLNCYTGCDFKRIVEALGLRESDLFHEPPPARTNGHHPPADKPTATYYFDYKDESGALLYQVVRKEYADKSKNHSQRRPDGANGWVYKLGDTRIVPYRLPELLQADPGEPVFIPEGEKHVDRLRKLGLIATCNPMGAGKWRAEFGEFLTDRDVIILPDNDEPGRKHAADIARSLRGRARSVRVLDLPGLPAKGDIIDWLNAGGTVENLANLAESCEEWTPPAPERIEPTTPGTTPDDLATLADKGISVDAIARANLHEQRNAEMLIERYGADLRFVEAEREFYAWDGKRWTPGRRKIRHFAVQTAKRFYSMAGEESTPPAAAAEYAKHAKKSLSLSSIEAVARLCENDLSLHIEVDQFDAKSRLLNVANGTIDLQTGELLPHDREHLNSKMIAIEYDPHAECPTWERAILQMFRGNRDIVSFVQRYAGYSATGDTGDQTFLILYGTGANGKSKLLGAIAEVLGAYHERAAAQTLFERRIDAASNDIAKLRGARMVTAIETEAGHKMAAALIKSITGQDTVTARFLFREHFTYAPRYKLWLAVNHRPQFDGSDDAMVRRLRLIPFDVKFEKIEDNPDTEFPRDDNLAEKLRAEYPGILRWIVDGAIMYCRDGLRPPEAVRVATKAYAAEMDTVRSFIAECCVTGDHGFFKVKAGDLMEAYQDYCRENGMTAVKGKAWKETLERLGYRQPPRTGRGIYWQGLALATRGEEDEPAL